MVSESPAEHRESTMLERKARARRAAAVLRRRVTNGVYAGLPPGRGDDLFFVTDLLDAAAVDLDGWPRQSGRALDKLVDRVLVDRKRPGDVAPLSVGDGV